MYLKFDEIERANKIRNFILRTASISTLDLCKCRKCKGTGLKNVHYDSKGNWTSWDGASYCEYCKGVGYHNPTDIDKSLYRCCICNGEGYIKNDPMNTPYNPYPKDCPNCKGFGFVNWIENLFGKKE